MGVGVEVTARQREGAIRRAGAKPQGGDRVPRGKTVRVTLHLEAETVERLGVHAALCHRDKSRVAGEILLAYLVRHGRGKGAFAPNLKVPGDCDPGADVQAALAG